MKRIFFIFLIGITPAYLTEFETSQLSSVESQTKEPRGSSEDAHEKCPNNKVLVQTLQVLKENLAQDENKLSPEKFKDILDNVIDYLSKSQADSDIGDGNASENVPNNLNSRTKKDALRTYWLDDYEPSHKLSGKITLQYEVPPVQSSDCQSLFKAIVNVIRAAYTQINTFCIETGKCQLKTESKQQKTTPDWVPPYEIPYKNGENALQSKIQGNGTRVTDIIRQYPQNIDLLTILQNYRPNSDISFKVNKLPSTAQELEINNLLKDNSNENINGIARQKDSILEMLSVLNRPSGYAKVTANSAPSIPSSAKLTIENLAPIQGIPSPSVAQQTLKLREPPNLEQMNITSIPNSGLVDDNNLRLKEQNLQVTLPHGPNSYGNQRVISKDISYKGLLNNPNYKLNLQYPQPNLLPHGVKLSGNQGSSELIHNQTPYYSASATYYQQPKLSPAYLTQQKQNLPNQQTFYNYHSQLPYLQTGQQSQQNIYFSNKQVPLYNSMYTGSERIPLQIDPRLADFYKNLNNTVGLNDLYRLSVTNGQKLNIAPNKNGLIELTFTLQRPQAVEYKPLYYVKYRLPYQTYVYNMQNLRAKPFLRSNAAKLYEELLAAANITESSQDLKDLDKDEISKLVATNGALVKAKVLDDSNSSVDDIVGEEVKNILKLSSRLGPEGMLNATKIAIHNIEEATVINKTHQEPKVDKSVDVNDTSNDVLNLSGNTKSEGSSMVNIPFLQGTLNGLPYIRPNHVFDKEVKPLKGSISNVFLPTVNN